MSINSVAFVLKHKPIRVHTRPIWCPPPSLAPPLVLMPISTPFPVQPDQHVPSVNSFKTALHRLSDVTNSHHWAMYSSSKGCTTMAGYYIHWKNWRYAIEPKWNVVILTAHATKVNHS